VKSHFPKSTYIYQFLGYVTLILAFQPTPAQQPTHKQTETVHGAEKVNDEEKQRRMFSTFKQQRQLANSSPTAVVSKNTDSGTPSSSGSDSSVAKDAFIGLTIWEMRESRNGVERRSFKLKKPNGQNVVLRPFRLGSEGQLIAGRSYVFSIESARTGYLYIIDREQYANGALGDPLLLFPTKEARNGIYKVTAGDVVEVPDQKNETAYFEATKNGQDHTGEALTIIVSSEPLVDASKLKEEPIMLDPDEVQKWDRQWATKTLWAENAEAIGRPYTEAEGHAGGDPNFKLKENDPLPQRLYQLGAKGGAPLIVTVTLRYANSTN
jgi:hypothetical protein